MCDWCKIVIPDSRDGHCLDPNILLCEKCFKLIEAQNNNYLKKAEKSKVKHEDDSHK